MFLLTILALSVAWFVAATSARWSKHWLFVPIAAILGFISAEIVTFALGVSLHYLNPQEISPQDAVMFSLRAASFSLIVAPVAAYFGWRKAIKSTTAP